MQHVMPVGWTRGGKPVYPIAGGSDPTTAAGSGSGGGQPDPSGDPPGQPDPAGQPPGPGQGQGGQPDPSGGTPTPANPDKGFPEGVPLEQMTVEQQAAYWRHYARQHEQRNKDLLKLGDGSYEGLKAKAESYDELRQQQQTDQEKAVEAAKAEGRSAGLREAASRMVDEHVAAAVSAGRLQQAQADVLLQGLDRNAYVTDDGRVDADKVKTLIDTFAPQPANDDGGSGSNGRGRHPDLGQGRRQGSPTSGGLEAGREQARQRFKPQQQQ